MMPVPLFDRGGRLGDSVVRQLRSCRRTVLLLDFDGTLAPIRKTPSEATLPSATKRLLRRLVAKPLVTVAVVTGRSHADIMQKVALRGPLFVTNHGFQISSGRVRWVHPDAKRAAPLIGRLARRLRRSLASVRKVLIENKKLTLTVHYRNVRKKDVRMVKKVVARMAHLYEAGLSVTSGKRVFEFRPRAAWGKGHAVLRILKSIGHPNSQSVVYIGDDTTDEDAFRMLAYPAVTVRVGRHRRSRAAYWAANPAQVRKFLEIVAQIDGEAG